MNTIPGKFKKLTHDVYETFKNILRRRPLVIEKPANEFTALEADYNALTSLSYFMLGTFMDCMLDIIYEIDVPKSEVNPLMSFIIAFVGFLVPMVLIFAEITGSVPGRATLYSYAYTGLSEVYAFMSGWIWLGAAAARVAMCIHYFTFSVIQVFESLVDLNIASDIVTFIIYVILPFVSRKVSVAVNIVGCIVRVVLVLFLAAYTKPSNWFQTVSPIYADGLVRSIFTYFQLYYTIPMVSTVLQSATRTRILVRKMIALIFCGALLQISFLLVLIGITPFDKSTKPWADTLIGQYRPKPYLYIFTISHYVCKICGVLAVAHGSSLLIKQMSRDGLLFRFLSSSERLSKTFFALCSIFIYLGGYKESRLVYEVLSSFGVMMGAICLLTCKCLGRINFYVRKRALPTDKKKVKKLIFFNAIVKSMLVFLVVGCFMASFVCENLLKGPFNPFQVEFFVFMIALCFVGVALLIISVAQKFRSVYADVRCPLGPFLPVFIFFIATLNTVLKIEYVFLPVIVWLFAGLIYYLIFGIKNVTVNVIPVVQQRAQQQSCHDAEFQDDQFYKLLHKAFDKYVADEEELQRELEKLKSPPLCFRKDFKIDLKKILKKRKSRVKKT